MGGGCTKEEKANPRPQTTCPVMGEKIDKKVFYDYQGKRIYFCCPGCVEEFKKNPDKYIKKLEKQEITLERTPAAGNLK